MEGRGGVRDGGDHRVEHPELAGRQKTQFLKDGEVKMTSYLTILFPYCLRIQPFLPQVRPPGNWWVCETYRHILNDCIYMNA